jgi:hypothetical protein
MAKKKNKPPSRLMREQGKTVIYLEVEPALKEWMQQLAKQHERKLMGECIVALKEYAQRHGKEEGGAAD